MFRPSEIGYVPDDDEHYVAFQDQSSSYGLFRSEGKKQIPVFDWETLSTQLRKESRFSSIEYLRQSMLEHEQSIIGIINSYLQKKLGHRALADFRPKDDPILRVASLSQIYLDCTMFLLKQR